MIYLFESGIIFFVKIEENVEITRTSNGNKVINGYLVKEILGKGSFSSVKLVQKNGKEYAMKKINKILLTKRKRGFSRGANGKPQVNSLLENALCEIEILKQLNHTNIIKLHEIINDTNRGKIYLIIDHCAKGSLMSFNEETQEFVVNKHISLSQYYSENQIKNFLYQIVLGLEYLHSKGIVHRDIKPDNILIDTNNHCKITDFNVSIMLHNDNDYIGKQTEGTTSFMAPELCSDQVRNVKGKPLDIWALGITAYILAYNDVPFKSTNEGNMLELLDSIERKDFVFRDDKREMSKEFKFFVRKCLEKDPNTRITIEEIKQLEWFNMKKQVNRFVKKNLKIKIDESNFRTQKRFVLQREIINI